MDREIARARFTRQAAKQGPEMPSRQEEPSDRSVNLLCPRDVFAICRQCGRSTQIGSSRTTMADLTAQSFPTNISARAEYCAVMEGKTAFCDLRSRFSHNDKDGRWI